MLHVVRSRSGDDPNLGIGTARAHPVVRTADYLVGHADRLPVGIEVEPVRQLPVPVLAGVRVDGARKYPCPASTSAKIARAHSFGSAVDRCRGRPVAVSMLCTSTVTTNPETAGAHGAAGTSNTVSEVWIRSAMLVPVRAGVVMMCGCAEGTSVVSSGSAGGCSAGRSPEGADTSKGYGFTRFTARAVTGTAATSGAGGRECPQSVCALR